MTDKINSALRSANMRAIPGQHTRPEMIVRQLAHRMGYRYRLHQRHLPGTPDLVFASRKKAIFVHGCFWHAHGCRTAHTPKSNVSYWHPKLERNKERDTENIVKLRLEGWSLLIIWECETKDHESLKQKLRCFFT